MCAMYTDTKVAARVPNSDLSSLVDALVPISHKPLSRLSRRGRMRCVSCAACHSAACPSAACPSLHVLRCVLCRAHVLATFTVMLI